MEIELGYIDIANWELGDPLFPEWDEDHSDLEENEIILAGNQEYTLVIDYPLHTPFKHVFRTHDDGMTREELLKLIVDSYHYVYDMEERSSKIKSGLIPGMYNRNATEGIYGIWGHDIDDLVLDSIELDKDNVITLNVSS